MMEDRFGKRAERLETREEWTSYWTRQSKIPARRNQMMARGMTSQERFAVMQDRIRCLIHQSRRHRRHRRAMEDEVTSQDRLWTEGHIWYLTHQLRTHPQNTQAMGHWVACHRGLTALDDHSHYATR
jgi:hypothetical protein